MKLYIIIRGFGSYYTYPVLTIYVLSGLNLFEDDMNNLIKLASFALSIFLTVSCTNNDESRIENDNLKPIFSFGSEEHNSLVNPLNIVPDGQNSLFISDQIGAQVLQFNLKGKLIKRFGNIGRGPGEVLNPSVLETDGERLYVQDPANLRIISFDLEDGSSSIFIQKEAFIEFEAYKEKLYGFAPKSFFTKADESDEKLIKVYDRKGNKLNSFGKYLTIANNLPLGMSWPLIEIEDNIIHVAFMYFPFYRAYDVNGKLLNETDLSKFEGIKKSDQVANDKNFSSGGSTTRDVVFRAMDAYKNRIFICRQGRSIIIDEFLFQDSELTHQTTYSYKKLPDDYYVKDFFYDKKSNSFYILEKNKIPKVTVYKIIK